jgi:hypothetical protein
MMSTAILEPRLSVVGLHRLARATMSEFLCAICLSGSANDDPTLALLCGHSFHKYCIDTFAEVSNTAVAVIGCPTCKLTAQDIEKICKAPLSWTVAACADANCEDEASESGAVAKSEDASTAASPDVKVEGEATEIGAVASASKGEAVAAASKGEAVAAASKGEAEAAASAASQDEAVAAASKGEAVASASKGEAVAAASKGEAVAAASKGEAEAVAVAFPSSSTSVAIPHPLFLEPSVFCSTCGSQVVLAKTRLLSKTQGTWRCSRCAIKITQLHRGFGEWPNATFKNLSPEQQQAFFRTADGSGQKIVGMAKELLEKNEEHESYYQNGGEYLPLGVWQTRGFDSAAIERNSDSSDIKMHPVLGDTYRVRILSGGERGSQGRKHTHVLSNSSKRPKTQQELANKAQQAQLALQAQPAEETPPEPSSSASSSMTSDSDSSSSSSSKKGKKSKKSKKSKKGKASKTKEKKGKNHKHSKKVKKEARTKNHDIEKAKTEAADKKALDKVHTSKKNLAHQVLSKVSPMVSSLASTIANPGSLQLPALIIESGRVSFEALQSLEKRAKLVMDDAKNDLGITTIKEASIMISQGKKTEVLMRQMMATLGKFSQG